MSLIEKQPNFYHNWSKINITDLGLKFLQLYNKQNTAVWRYEFYLLVVKTRFYSLAALVRKILFPPLEDKIHIFASPPSILYVNSRYELKQDNSFALQNYYAKLLSCCCSSYLKLTRCYSSEHVFSYTLLSCLLVMSFFVINSYKNLISEFKKNILLVYIFKI